MDENSSSPISHRLHRLLIPIEVRPNVGAALAAGRADETWLKIGQPHVVRPSIAAYRDQVAAFVIGAVNQETGIGTN
jgi:hypothetical protein